MLQRGIIQGVTKTDAGLVRYSVKLVAKEIIVRATQVTTFHSSTDHAGVIFEYKVNDVVLVSEVDGDSDFVVVGSESRVTAPTEGTLSLCAKRIELGSNATEPLLLGNITLSAMTDLSQLVDDLLRVFSAGNFVNSSIPASPTLPNPVGTQAFTKAIADLQLWKAKYITNDSTNIVSKLTFTKREGI